MPKISYTKSLGKAAYTAVYIFMWNLRDTSVKAKVINYDTSDAAHSFPSLRFSFQTFGQI